MPRETGTRGKPKGGSGKKGRSEDGDKVEAFVRRQSPFHQRTINGLRTIVKVAAPELEERMRWLQVGYLLSKKDVCGIYPSSDHVNLSFSQGATLADPKGLLEGTGKGMRHIKIRELEDADVEAITAYVREAVASAKTS